MGSINGILAQPIGCSPYISTRKSQIFKVLIAGSPPTFIRGIPRHKSNVKQMAFSENDIGTCNCHNFTGKFRREQRIHTVRARKRARDIGIEEGGRKEGGRKDDSRKDAGRKDDRRDDW